MVPRAPVPHLDHPHIVHARRPGPLGRMVERISAPFVVPLLMLWAAVLWMASLFSVTTVRPGVNVNVRLANVPAGPPTDTGVWFVGGQAERGDTNNPVLLRNMGDYDTYLGARVAYSVLYDALDTFFHEGGTKAYVIRAVGPAATKGTLVLLDRAGGGGVATLNVNAISAGAWSTGLAVEVENGVAANSYTLTIWYQGAVKEKTGDLFSPTDAVTWSLGSKWVRITDALSATAAPNNIPKVVASPGTALSAGNDDRAAITDAVRTAQLAKIPKELGPGQVSWPGATTDAIHGALGNHARDCNRTALLDLPDDGTVASMVASVLTNTAAEPERCGAFGPQVVVPGLTANTTRAVPASAVVAGLIARNDAVGGTSSPAAGTKGQSRYAIDVTHQFTDADRGVANLGGVNIIRPLFGPITLYGFRSCSTNPQWVSLSDQRLRMEIVNLAEIIGEDFMFDVLDGQGHTIAAFGGALTGMLAGFYNRGALFGATVDEAYSVNVGPAVNTIETIANGELHAVIGLKMSPFAEVVFIEIVKTPITQPL